jgi:hypothetical protein
MSDLKTLALERKLLPRVAASLLPVLLIFPYVVLTANGVNLGGNYLITWLTANLADVYNWRHAYIAVIVMILLCPLLALVFAVNDKLRRALPLYQMDILGVLLLAFLLMLINYVAVYGNAEKWWESSNITAASTLIPMILLAFIARELIVERPLLPLGNLKIDSLIKNKKNGNIKIANVAVAKLGLLSDHG